MGIVVSPVRNRAQRGKRDTVVSTDLRHSSPFHFHRQRFGQGLLQGPAFGRGRDKTVATGDQAGVQAWRMQRKFGHRSTPHMGRHLRQHLLRSQGQPSRESGIGCKSTAAVQRHLVPREQRRGIHVVLHKAVRQHHIAHANPGADTARHTREHDLLNTKALDQRRGRGRRRHLADPRKHHHHRTPLPVPQPKVSPGHSHALLVRHGLQQQDQLLVHGTHQTDRGGRGHGQLQKKAATAGPLASLASKAQLAVRNSRRRILPTGVLGSSLLNSTRRGTL